MTDKPRFEMSVDTKMVYDRLLGIGETIGYDQLSELVGRDIRDGAYGSLMSARRRALNHDGVLFDAVTNVGLKRMSDPEIVSAGQRDIDKIRRAARRGYTKLTCVQNFDSLPEDERVKHNTFQTVFSALNTVTKAPAIARVEKHVSKTMQTLPLAKTLEAFSE